MPPHPAQIPIAFTPAGPDHSAFPPPTQILLAVAW